MMPPPSRAMAGAATVHLALGFSLGAFTLLAKASGTASPLWLLRETHIHGLLFGWLVQFAMGVALAIFPRLASGPPRGDPRAAWGCFVMINTGALCGGLAPIATLMSGPFAGAVLSALAGVSFAAAVALFMLLMWARVRTVNPIWPVDLPVARGQK